MNTKCFITIQFLNLYLKYLGWVKTYYPLINQYNYGQLPFCMGKSGIFYGYVQ